MPKLETEPVYISVRAIAVRWATDPRTVLRHVSGLPGVLKFPAARGGTGSRYSMLRVPIAAVLDIEAQLASDGAATHAEEGLAS
jgi:hypothetical protein